MGDQLRVAVRPGEGCTVVALAGGWDVADSAGFRDVIMSQVLWGVRRLVLDFSGLLFMASAVVRQLLFVRDVLVGLGGSLVAACLRPAVARVLELSPADTPIPVYGSVDEAAAAG